MLHSQARDFLLHIPIWSPDTPWYNTNLSEASDKVAVGPDLSRHLEGRLAAAYVRLDSGQHVTGPAHLPELGVGGAVHIQGYLGCVGEISMKNHSFAHFSRLHSAYIDIHLSDQPKGFRPKTEERNFRGPPSAENI